MARNLRLLLACALLLAAPGARADDSLTRAQIMGLFASIEKAVERHDADTIASHFAPDAVITLILPPAAGGQTLNMNVEQYRSMLKEGWNQGGRSTYAVQDIEIQIRADGRTADVSDTTVETIQVGGRTVSSRTRETFSVRLIGGKPL